MGYRLASVFSTTFIGPLPAGAAETLVFTTPPISLPVDNTFVQLDFMCVILTGASTTALVYLIRRGTLVTSPLVTPTGIQDAAAAVTEVVTAGMWVDSPGAVGGVQYSLTVQQTAATAAGTFATGILRAAVL